MALAGPTSNSHAKTFAVSLRALGRRSPTGQPAPAAATSTREPALEGFRKALLGTLRQVSRPTTAILFVAGTPTPAPLLAEVVADVARGIDCLIVPSSGILSEGGEVEGVAATSGVVFSCSSAAVVVGESPEEVAQALGTAKTVLTFHAADGFETPDVEVVARGRGVVFGAGAPGTAVWAVRRGKISSGRVAAMRLDGSAPIVEATPACKLVTEPLVVTEVDRNLVTRLSGEPALDVLSSKAGGGRYGGLILVAFHDPGDPSRFLVRPLRGIDPGRKAIAIAGDVALGDTISFAVRDAEAAREGLASAGRRAERQVLGSAPTFALYLSCAGRGRSLYGEADGDVRVLRKRFPRIPIAGMHSAFEIVPWAEGVARMQLMSGVLALFRAPS